MPIAMGTNLASTSDAITALARTTPIGYTAAPMRAHMKKYPAPASVVRVAR